MMMMMMITWTGDCAGRQCSPSIVQDSAAEAHTPPHPGDTSSPPDTWSGDNDNDNDDNDDDDDYLTHVHPGDTGAGAGEVCEPPDVLTVLVRVVTPETPDCRVNIFQKYRRKIGNLSRKLVKKVKN